MKTKPVGAEGVGRRDWLKRATAVPAAAAVAAGLPAARAPGAAPAVPAAGDERPRGYHLSDHIRRYYALARY